MKHIEEMLTAINLGENRFLSLESCTFSISGHALIKIVDSIVFDARFQVGEGLSIQYFRLFCTPGKSFIMTFRYRSVYGLWYIGD